MPLDQREQLTLAVLLLCVPLQYFAGRYMGSSEISRSYAISKMITQLEAIGSKWFRVEPWKRWCVRMLARITEGGIPTTAGEAPEDAMEGESPAVEVLKFREEKGGGHFASSAQPRNPRSPHVEFRVGQVVKHKLWGYHGVIIGWDETAKAPKDWLKAMHGGHAEWKEQPNYAVLVDTRDRPAPQLTYVPQENIEPVKSITIKHPSVDDYFEKYDGSQYLPRPWLKTVYPRD